MDVNSLPKTVARQRRGCDLNPGPTVSESSTLTTRLPSHPVYCSELLSSSSPAAAAVVASLTHTVADRLLTSVAVLQLTTIYNLLQC